MKWEKFKKQDWIITIISLLLMIFGLLVIFSTTFNLKTEGLNESEKQIIFIIIGLITYSLILITDFSWFKNASIIKIIYLITIALLVYVRFFAPASANTYRWINLGFFSIQPSEYAKITIILILALMMSKLDQEIYLNKFNKHKKLNFILNKLKLNLYGKQLFKSLVLILPIIILTLIQPSLGNAIISISIWLLTATLLFPDHKNLFVYLIYIVLNVLILFNIIYIERVGAELIIKQIQSPNYILIAICFILMVIIKFIANIKITKLIFILISTLLIVLGFILFWNHGLTTYQRGRIDILLQGPETDPTKGGYQVIQAKTAIGSGMLLGRGFLSGTQSSLNVLTQSSTDFIFAAFAEQFGFIGCLIIFFLYITLLFRIIFIAEKTNDLFSKYVVYGVAVFLFIHIAINISMNLGLIPVTGITLPLMSYGGSSVLTIMICLGLVQSVNTSYKPVDIATDLMLISPDSTIKKNKKN